MILLSAVIIGLAAGLIRARCTGRSYQPYQLKHTWLVLLAFIPQWLAFVLPATRTHLPNPWAPPILVTSQVILLVFCLLNWQKPGFWLLGLGLFLNLGVILLNGGLMPISPATAAWLVPNSSGNLWQVGERFGTGKDIVLSAASTRLWILSDRLITPDWLHYRLAFSLGDVLVAVGTIWVLWSNAGTIKNYDVRSYEHIISTHSTG